MNSFPHVIGDHLALQGYYIADNFFEEELYQLLASVAQSIHQKGLFQSAKIGMHIQAKHNSFIRKDEIYWLDHVCEYPSVKLYLQRMNELAISLNQLLFLSLSEFETHFAVYQPGSFYRKHVDQFHVTKTRKISCVYYLNKNWQSCFGGALKLYSQKDELVEEIAPLGNRFVCFDSELPHEVCATSQTRYSIAGWMKTRPL